MGGDKKKPAAQMDKGKDEGKKESSGKKDRKQEKTEKKAEITVVLSEDQAIKLIKANNFITVQDLSRQTGVKISAANTCLVNLLKKGAVKRTGGYSGHWIYQPVA